MKPQCSCSPTLRLKRAALGIEDYGESSSEDEEEEGAEGGDEGEGEEAGGSEEAEGWEGVEGYDEGAVTCDAGGRSGPCLGGSIAEADERCA